MSSKTTSKSITKAAKTLSNPHASSRSKTDAGKTLARHSAKMRTIQSAPKSGKFNLSAIKHAVKSVSATDKKK
jgi:hypothetical protein